ncbi:MAG: glycogen/starch/alpha-glucan family phosphorylase [Simkaniaceae bacterium]|nr:glycogen/starch/alpha-glucan family phosphorylase [Simkaniaceae bacterium]
MNELESYARTFAQRVRHYLMITTGYREDEAGSEELYGALCTSLREEIMVNWHATQRTFHQQRSRMLYYLSMEYMPGRLLGSAVTHTHADELIRRVLRILQRPYDEVLRAEPDPGTGNGGLGRLASCFMDSLATLQYPAFGYGMRYHYGIFEQEMVCGVQVERPDCWLLKHNPWEFRRDGDAVPVYFSGTPVKRKTGRGEVTVDLIDCEEIRALPYDLPMIGYGRGDNFSVLTLRLWSTKESPRNFQLQRYNAGELGPASENTSLTDVLYPNDDNEAGKRIRLKQEFLLVSASLRDIVRRYLTQHETFDAFPDKVCIQINDTHPALIIPELIRILVKESDLSFKEAFEITKTCVGYTNHTILKEALEEWNTSRMQTLLPDRFHLIERIHDELLREVARTFPEDPGKGERMAIIGEGQVRMARLAIYGSHKVNGVSRLHTEILKTSLFKDFHELDPDKFVNVTNGITQRRWLLRCNPKLAAFISDRIGHGWITDFTTIRKLADFASDTQSQEEFAEIKLANKKRFTEMMRRDMEKRHGVDETFMRECTLETNKLYDVQVKRIHEYKRQLMNALHLLILYRQRKRNPPPLPVGRLVLFGGKAAPGYLLAKDIIRFIYCLARKINNDPEVSRDLRIHYVENYNVTRAETIIPAADLSEQISTAGMEASGTGNMKFAINGALTIGTDDGANVEMRESITDRWWPFRFGNSAEENLLLMQKGAYDPVKIYETDPDIKGAIDALTDNSLTENEAEAETLSKIRDSLLVDGDPFFVLNDLPSYIATQKQVEKLYASPEKWAEYAIHNIAGMGPFSSDVAVATYAEKVWKLRPRPPDPAILKQVRSDYDRHDRCRIDTP